MTPLQYGDRIIFYNKIHPEIMMVQEDDYILHNNE
jgi:hypothetical protein